MTEYKLKEFLEWLQIQVQKRDDWSFHLKFNCFAISNKGKIVCVETLVEGDNWKKVLLGEKPIIRGNYGLSFPKGYEILEEWKQEVDQRERERERETRTTK